ncbi:MAG: hypothetical protein ACRCXH_07460, partial [Shewanella sp.]
ALPGVGLLADAAQRIAPRAAVDKQLAQLKATQQGAAEAYEPLKKEFPVITGIGEAGPAMVVPAVGAKAVVLNMMARGAVAGALPEALSYGTAAERAKNAGVGALAGGLGAGAGYGVGKAITKAPSLARSLLDPFSEKGQKTIVGNVFNEAAGGEKFARQAIDNLRAAREIVPGSAPMAGQVAGSDGIASLSRTAAATNQEFAAEMQIRKAAQAQARNALMDELADPAKLSALDGAREQATNAIYARAMQQMPQNSPELSAAMAGLMERPAFQQAMKAGEIEALNQGLKVGANTPQSMHLAKLALDKQIKDAASRKEVVPQGLMSTKEALLNTLESPGFAPDYRVARETFASMSKPMDEIKIAQAIQEAATNKATGNMTPNAFARAMSDRTAQRATKFSGATLDNALSPEYASKLGALRADLLRDLAAESGKSSGSDTLQKAAYANILSASGVPTGLRNLMPAQTVANMLARVGDVAYGAQNKKISTLAAEAGMSPQMLADMMEQALMKNRTGVVGQYLPRGTGLMGAGGGLYALERE